MAYFHYRCGERITLINDNCTAIRNENEFDHGLVISAEPLQNDVLFEIKIDKKVNSWSGSLEIGVVDCDPLHFDFPPCASRVQSGSWIMSGTTVFKNGACLVEGYGMDLDRLNQEDRIGLMRTSEGDLIFYINGESQGVGAEDLPPVVYAIVDLYGKCVQVTITSPAYREHNNDDCLSGSSVLAIDNDILNVTLGGDLSELSMSSSNSLDIRMDMNVSLSLPEEVPRQDRLRFHDRCGSLVKLSNASRSAERRRPLDEFNNGVVMTQRPLRDSELFEIRIDRLVDKWSGSIEKFLASGLFTKTLKAFNDELEEYKILPTRIDWTGENHERTVEDMVRQFPNIRSDYLLHLCYEATKSNNKETLSDGRKSFLSFRPNIYQFDEILTNFRQYYNYVTRIHGAPVQHINNPCNLVNSLRGREVSGSLSRHRIINPKFFSNLQKQRITVGHLSAVYCLLFDRSGKYIITGADDLLIKLWSTHTGRLISVFRGANSEITDIAINSENTLLAAGSIDRVLRVWNLHNGTPVAVLTGHNGMITSVNFCPTPCLHVRYLISTSTDGTIAFWPYTYESAFNVEFKNNPIMYQEKLRPGQAQMICSSFSPGGTFLATGSADHYVRVYYMKGDEGPHRILEMESHSERVDSIQWAHSGLKFLSGSKDGMAIIWWFERQQWKSIHLDMSTKINTINKTAEPDNKKLKVTMVCWNLLDYWVITAVSDHSLKLWTANNGQLVKVLTGHTDEIFVLEAHPHEENIILSAGHDGQLFIWDILKGEIVFRFLNTIEGQGFGALYDVKWSPDGCVIAGSDSHGHILIFGFGCGSPFYQQLPQELFFHTDYRPLVRDSNYHVLDEQTQIPPHLMPPPFLVDIDGNPYPPMLQRLVPGREFCNLNQLVPNIVIGNEGTQEVIQDIPQNHMANLASNNEDEPQEGSSFRPGRRSSIRDHERIRQSTGDWQSDPTFEWHKVTLVPPLRKAIFERDKEIRDSLKDAEMEEYQRQLRQRPHMISINTSNNIKKKEEKGKRKKATKYVTRSAVTVEYKEDEPETSGNENDTDTSGSSEWMVEEEHHTGRPTRSSRRHGTTLEPDTEIEDEDLEVYDDDDYNEDYDYDDAGPSYSKTKENSSNKSKENSNSKNRENHTGKIKRNTSNRKTKNANRNNNSPKNDESLRNSGSIREKKSLSEILGPSTSGIPKSSKLTKISEQYRLSEWLSETRPRKSPYYPQLGDEVVYFVQGHQLYLNAVEMKEVYEISTKELPWNKMKIQPHEFVKVIGIQYEIKPPRLCCLKLALMDEEGRLTGKTFTVKYHDMPDVLDFFVLKQIYTTAMSRKWKNGNKFRCMIDEEWWIGEIINKSPASDAFPHSTFLCYEIRWNNGEQERMSPWDMEVVDHDRMPEDESQSIAVLEEELSLILYKTIQCDWPYSDLTAITKNIVSGLTRVMELAIAEPFLVPVDINVYPAYAMVIEYPIDLSTIKSRFENRFYRRLSAAQFDIRYLATNAEKFNEKHSNIVKHAKILTELCLRILRNCSSCVDVPSIYHRLVNSYDSSESEDETEIASSSNKNLRVNKRSVDEKHYWKKDVLKIIDLIWQNEDSVPFRYPVESAEYPDYYQIVLNPIDLHTIKENVINNIYDNPEEFSADMKLIFSNSRLYTPNKKSKIYDITSRLEKTFEEQFKRCISNLKSTTKGRRRKKSASTDESNESSNSDSNDSESNVSVEDNSDNDENQSFNTSRVNSESDSTSISNEKITRSKTRKVDAESEEEYCPRDVTRRKDYKTSSSEDASSSEDNFKTTNNLRERRTRKKVIYQDSNSEESSDSNKRPKRIKRLSQSDESMKSDRTDASREEVNTFISTVSSRGRVRKMTERAKALFKKR